MTYYVISDTHSFFTEAKVALENAGFFKDNDSKLILCGDALDRGTETNEIIDFLLDLHSKNRLIYIKGNHEDLFEECLDMLEIYGLIRLPSYHKSNGTLNSVLDISKMSKFDVLDNPTEAVNRVINSDYYKILLNSTIDYFEIEHYIFTHGYIPVIDDIYSYNNPYSYNKDWRNSSKEGFYKSRWLNGMEMACEHNIIEPNKTIVCGHFHSSWGHSKIDHLCTEFGMDSIFTPFKHEGIINIDACTVLTKMVNCVKIED